MRKLTVLILVLAATAAALSQEAAQTSSAQNTTTAEAQANPLSAWHRKVYGYVKPVLLRSAEKMGEENYSFKPAPTVRSFGELLGHAAQSQYYFCSVALGEKNPAPKIEGVKTSKAELIAALKEAFAYCDRAYDGMTDASATETVKLMGSDTPKLGVLAANQLHMLEHYGNLITYMRMKNVVPPSSEPPAQPEPKK